MSPLKDARSFDLSMTNTVKGVALILLLWHHLFYQLPEYGALVHTSAQIAKVCVGLFLLLSGYGLFESSRRMEKFEWTSFYAKRFVKLYFNYWLIALLFIPVGVFVFGRTFSDVYGNHAFIKFIVNMLGLQTYVFGYGYNPTWWFVGLIAPLYAAFPLILPFVRKWPFCSVLLSVACTFIHHVPFEDWQLSFVIGIFLARTNGIVHTSAFLTRFKSWRWLFLLLVVLAASLVYRENWLNAGCKNAVLALAITQLSYELAVSIPQLQRLLATVGEHSFNIFLFHTFIYGYYFRGEIYAFQYPIAILSALLSVCLAVSVAIEYAKTVIRFGSMESWTIKRLSGLQNRVLSLLMPRGGWITC